MIFISSVLSVLYLLYFYCCFSSVINQFTWKCQIWFQFFLFSQPLNIFILLQHSKILTQTKTNTNTHTLTHIHTLSYTNTHTHNTGFLSSGGDGMIRLWQIGDGRSQDCLRSFKIPNAEPNVRYHWNRKTFFFHYFN